MRDVGDPGMDTHVLAHGTSVRLRHALPRSLTVRSEHSADSLCAHSDSDVASVTSHRLLSSHLAGYDTTTP